MSSFDSSPFRGESAFATWVYRVAANYLLTVRKSRLEKQRYTFDRFGAELGEGVSDEAASYDAADAALLLEEVKIGCTLACCSASTVPIA